MFLPIPSLSGGYDQTLSTPGAFLTVSLEVASIILLCSLLLLLLASISGAPLAIRTR